MTQVRCRQAPGARLCMPILLPLMLVMLPLAEGLQAAGRSPSPAADSAAAPVLVRLCLWVLAARMAEFAAAYEMEVLPLLLDNGLTPSALEPRRLDPIRGRADNYSMPGFEISWEVDAAKDGLASHIDEEGGYPESDRCISFHGAHVVDSTKELSSGHILEVNSQSGVLYSENPAAVSPRNYATCFDRGSTIKDASGGTLGDVMLLEDTDADGDVAWLYHLWWYGQGGGIYKFIGGTGKWKGIVGDGKTGEMVAQRADDHYMLRSEIRWRIE